MHQFDNKKENHRNEPFQRPSGAVANFPNALTMLHFSLCPIECWMFCLCLALSLLDWIREVNTQHCRFSLHSESVVKSPFAMWCGRLKNDVILWEKYFKRKLIDKLVCSKQNLLISNNWNLFKWQKVLWDWCLIEDKITWNWITFNGI